MYRCAGQKDTGACEAGGRGYVKVGLAAPEPHPPASQVWTVTRYVPVHTSRPCGCAAPRRDDHRVFLGGLRPPTPSRRWGHGETRCPHSPAGRGRGETRFPHTPRRGRMFTLAVHAAVPHNAVINLRLFLGGLRLPKPSRGWGNGETRFPHSPRRGRMFTLAVHAAAPHKAVINIRLFLGGLRPSTPSRRWGHGETRCPHSPRRGRMFT